MSRCRRYLFGFYTYLLLSCAGIGATYAQNLTSEKIQVAADALTVLKFNSEITHCELGMRDGFTCLVRDNDNTVVIKTLDPGPASTNLAITEGKRTHYFILNFLPKIDINNTKLFYDYSDLKALKRLVAKRAEKGSEEPVAAVTAAVTEPPAKKSKKEEAADKKHREEEQKKVQDELARLQELQRKKDLAREQELAQQKALAAAAEAEKKQAAEDKIRQAKEAKEAAALAKVRAAEEKKNAAAKQAAAKADAKAKAEEEKKLAAAKTKAVESPVPEPAVKKTEPVVAGGKIEPKTEEPRKLNRREERELRKQKEQEEAEAAAKAEAARKEAEAAVAAKEKARLDELERQQMIAAEKERKAQEALQVKRDAIAAKAAEKEAAKRKKLEEAAANEAKRKEALEAEKQRLAAESVTLPALRKKYPTINFADIPEGQMITGEYFRVEDTLENYLQCMKTLLEEPCLGLTSNPVDGIDMRLDDINFSGVNAYLRVHIRNQSKSEYLVGRMLLRWNKADGGGYNLYACYVTGFPVIPAGGETNLVYVARGVNMHDEDLMYFRMSDRVREGRMVEIPFSGKIYNDELKRK